MKKSNPSPPPGQGQILISRSKHLPYIASYHGPWLSLPIELLESLYAINCEAGKKDPSLEDLTLTDQPSIPPPPIDPVIFKNLVTIRKMVDEASELVVKAAGTDKDGLTDRLPRDRMSPLRQHRLRELAVQKLAKAYRIDEVATSVLTMQSASALDDVAKLVLKKSPDNHDALYVHFFHEKIPSRMLATSTTTQDLDLIIDANPTNGEYYRTRAMVRCFREEFEKSVKDFKVALQLTKKANQDRQMLWDAAGQAAIQEASKGKKKGQKHNFTPQMQSIITTAANSCQSDPTKASETVKKLLNLSEDAEFGSEAQIYFLRAACYHQWAIGLIDKAISKVVKEKDVPLQNYTKELEGLFDQVCNLTKKSNRDYQHFLAYFPNTKPVDKVESNGLDKFLTQVPAALETMEERKEKQLEKKEERRRRTLDATYHPLLVEAWYAIGLNYILMGDWSAATSWHERVTRMQSNAEGYPVFLPARSMAQADYIEVLTRLKKQVKKEVVQRPRDQRQYPLHTKRAENVMVWLSSVVLNPSRPSITS